MKSFITELPVLSLSALAALCFGVLSGCGTDNEETPLHEKEQHEASDEHGHEHEHEHEHGHEQGHEHEKGDHAQKHDPQSVTVTEKSLSNLGVHVSAMKPELYYDKLKIPGLIQVDFDRRVEISSPAMVRILKLDAPPASTVNPGQRLGVLEFADPDVRHLQMKAVEFRAELLAAETEYERTNAYLEALKARGSEAGEEIRRVTADAAIAQAKVQSRKSALNAALDSLKVTGLNAAQIKNLKEKGNVATRIFIHAPRLKGSPELEISGRPVNTGQTVPAGTSLFELVALDRLLVVGEAFEADLPAVRKAMEDGLPVTLLFPAENRTVEGLKISSIEGTIHDEERITHFFIKLPNRLLSEKKEGDLRYLDWENRAGSKVQILVATQKMGRKFVLPANAVIHEAGVSWVFKKMGDEFIRMEVKVESESDRLAVLPEDCGLSAGDLVVTHGALQVHLLLNKKLGEHVQAGHHHSHHH